MTGMMKEVFGEDHCGKVLVCKLECDGGRFWIRNVSGPGGKLCSAPFNECLPLHSAKSPILGSSLFWLSSESGSSSSFNCFLRDLTACF